MQVYRQRADGFLTSILQDPDGPGRVVIVYRVGESIPYFAPISATPPPEHGEARYIVRDGSGWYYAADQKIGIGNGRLRRVGPIMAHPAR